MPSRSDVEEHQLYGLPLLIYTVVTRLAATLGGQFLLHLADRVLWTVENLTYWAIPPQRLAEFSNAPQSPLVRPLSWWLFLPGLLWLRLIRKSCSVALWFVGIEPVTPVSMVYYVQVQRKKIHLIKQSGATVIRKRREEAAKRPNLLRAIWIKLQKIFCLEYFYEVDGEVKIMEPKDTVDNEESSESAPEETELSFAELLEKYANVENDDEDSDYVPGEQPSTGSSEEESDADEDDEDLVFRDDDESRKVLNSSFVCESIQTPFQSLRRTQTPPLRAGHSNLLSPSDNSTPYNYQSASKDQEGKVQNGTSVDRRKASGTKRSNQKYRGGINNRWNIKQKNNVRKPPVITVSTNNAGGHYLNANDAAKSAMSAGASGSAKSTQSKEMKKDSDRNREIF